MHAPVEHARTFREKITGQQEEFAPLSRGQQPQELFISCSGSRVACMSALRNWADQHNAHTVQPASAGAWT
ncbi:hypothetical protein ACGF5O_14905 [Streptomyces sp. NPDC048291]|uniref:hypothetical protein n=1 Tax=Streptomyces sp. NPDC048291 TaxID=3365530 RepID=UPI00372152BA